MIQREVGFNPVSRGFKFLVWWFKFQNLDLGCMDFDLNLWVLKFWVFDWVWRLWWNWGGLLIGLIVSGYVGRFGQGPCLVVLEFCVRMSEVGDGFEFWVIILVWTGDDGCWIWRMAVDCCKFWVDGDGLFSVMVAEWWNGGFGQGGLLGMDLDMGFNWIGRSGLDIVIDYGLMIKLGSLILLQGCDWRE